MDIQPAFAQALKATRKAKGLTQEDFSEVSSRTYLSTLERGLKNPTLVKIDAIAQTLNVHPLTLLVLTYLQVDEASGLPALLQRVQHELGEIEASSK